LERRVLRNSFSQKKNWENQGSIHTHTKNRVSVMFHPPGKCEYTRMITGWVRGAASSLKRDPRTNTRKNSALRWSLRGIWVGSRHRQALKTTTMGT
jgi:hypothetical protein